MNEQLLHALRTNADQEFHFAPSKAKRLTLTILCLLFAAAMLALGRDNRGMMILGVVLFGLLALVAAHGLIPGREFFRIGRDGFEVRSLFRHHSVRWSDVREFGVYYWRSNVFVAWKLLPGRGKSDAARTGGGWDGAIPDTYGFDAIQLAEIMNARLAMSR